MKCPNIHKLCPTANCEKVVCRAYFPERQPIIKPDMLETICQTDEHLECLQHIEGEAWKAERKRKWLAEHCRFASNSVCGSPHEWWCKGSQVPFKLYPVETEDGEEVDNREIMKMTCWTGNVSIHEECPHYKAGVALREYVREFKKKES